MTVNAGICAAAANGQLSPHLYRKMMFDGCTCGEGLFFPLLVQHWTAARVADP